MSAAKPAVAVRDLVEEAKKRIVFLAICVVGLSYLMSLTSSSVWVNLPAAGFLIIVIRYLSLDFEMRRKAAAYNSKPSSTNSVSQKRSPEGPKIIEKFDWRSKVNSSVVEDAIDQFTRHLVSEWVTDLWYSRITPDKEGPEELVQIMNGVLGEISSRARNVNLIDLLTRDLINLICTHLELFRATQGKIVKKQLGSLTIGDRDKELKLVLAAENKLHPALFSAEAEHKVLQHLVDGLIVITFKPEDLQCSFFRYTVRELLACAVIRPVLNLANPRFINEKIESLVISATKANKGGTTAQEASQPKQNGSSRISSDHFSRFLDPTVTGVELVQLKNDQSRTAADETGKNNANGTHLSKDPLLLIDTQSTRSWGSVPSGPLTGDGKGIQRHRSGGEWGDMLDIVSRRKTQVLAPENLENIWTKGRNYKKKEDRLAGHVSQSSLAEKTDAVNNSKGIHNPKEKDGTSKIQCTQSSVTVSGCNDLSTTKVLSACADLNMSTHSSNTLYQEDDDHGPMRLEEVETESSSSYTTEDEETSTVTGLDSPVTKVWDGRNNRNLAVSHIRHPLESSEGHTGKKTNKGHVHYRTLPRNHSGRKRSRLNNQKVHVWQEVERTSFLSGDGQDILNSSKGHEKSEDSSDDSEMEMLGRVNSGAAASSSAPSTSKSESHSFSVNALQNSLLADSFLKLRCEVLGANIVKSGSRTFAVYSISVTDINNNSWSIKRRFRHFEELHRRLKEFPEYNLHLPPKHFLSTGLDMFVIQERCNLLDKYLKKLLQLPTVSGSIEVWDFLSVDSQTYIFSNSISIIETLSVNLHCKPAEKSNKVSDFAGPLVNPLPSRRSHLGSESKEPPLQTKHNHLINQRRLTEKGTNYSLVEKPVKECGKPFDDSGSDSDTMVQKNASSTGNLARKVKGREGDGLLQTSEVPSDAENDPSLPTEWVPPSLTVPILDLVDVVFQLQDGGWIRRKAFWVAKQVLQLGMGDAFDDWLIEKIQLLRRGSVIASGIKRVEQILWPDGIFLTKHPKRRRPPVPPMSPSHMSPPGQQPAQMSSPKKEDLQKLQQMEQILAFEELQRQEADRRAKFVYELMIDNPPAAMVGLVGRKEYEQCAKDLYFFLQSSVCLKMLVYDLLELLLLSAFPELDVTFKKLQEERHKFGELKVN